MIWLFYIFQILIVAATISVIMLQKNSEGIFSASKAFGIRGRSNTMIRLTYVLGMIFFINCLVLGILYQKKHKEELIKENSSKVLKTEKVNADGK